MRKHFRQCSDAGFFRLASMMPKVRASATLKPPGDLRQPVLDIFAIGEVERRARGKLFENRPQVDLFARLLEFLDMFLKAVGNRQIERPHEDPAIRLGGRFAPQQEIVQLMINEVAVALEVLLVDIRASDGLEEPLEFRDAYDVGWSTTFSIAR